MEFSAHHRTVAGPTLDGGGRGCGTGHLRAEEWANGYAAEAAGALIRWAFTQDIGELYAVAIPSNTRAIATCQRLGMQWVGETNKYYDHRTLQVHRIRPGDLEDS